MYRKGWVAAKLLCFLLIDAFAQNAHGLDTYQEVDASTIRWPPGAFLQIGSDEPSFGTATVRAGLPYTGLVLNFPSSCTSARTVGDGSTPEMLAHIHGTTLQAAVTVRAESNAYIFIGHSLPDAYEIVLEGTDGLTVIRRNGLSVKYKGKSSLLDGGSTDQKFWVLLQTIGAEGRVLLGRGHNVGQSAILRLVDKVQTLAKSLSESKFLWVTTGSGIAAHWNVCLLRHHQGSTDFAEHQTPKLKVVDSTAQTVDCVGNEHDVPMANVQLATHGGVTGPFSLWPLALQFSVRGLVWSGQPGFKFMIGGKHRLCYHVDASNRCVCVASICRCSVDRKPCAITQAPSGSCNAFAEGSQMSLSQQTKLVFASLRVIGVVSNCRRDGCMDHERWDCYFNYDGLLGGPCVVDLSLSTGRSGWSLFPDRESKMTLTVEYAQDTIYDGAAIKSYPVACGPSEPFPPTSFIFTGSFPSYHLRQNHSHSGPGPTELPPVHPSVKDSFTTGMCYCPGVASSAGALACSSTADFVQPFGRLYMWVVHICDFSSTNSCPIKYLRVLPQQKFSLQVRCPPAGACMPGAHNRIKFVDPSGGNVGWNNWDSGSACRVQAEESRLAIWPLESHSLTLDGGNRTDVKVWGSELVRLDLSTNQSLNLCYCNAKCSVASNWLQVGIVRTTQSFAFASSAGSADSTVKTIEYLNKPGSFTLLGSIVSAGVQATVSPYDSNSYSGDALLKLIPFDRTSDSTQKSLRERHGFDKLGFVDLQSVLDEECQRTGYPRDLIEGLNGTSEARDRIALVHVDPRLGDRYLVFAGRSKTMTITPMKSGTLAACYCAMVVDQRCLAEKHWIFTGLLQIRGPRGGQDWVLPTRQVVRIAGITGWGFASTDRLRVVRAGTKEAGLCENQDNRDPIGETDVFVGCPGDANGIGATPCMHASSNELLEVVLASSATTGINLLGINIESERSSVLSFSGPIIDHISPGDAITVDLKSIRVGGKDLDYMSDIERQQAYQLSGHAHFQDDRGATFSHNWHRVRYLNREELVRAASERQVPPDRLRIPIGWNINHPHAPTFLFTQGANREQWARRNTIDTRSELRANAPLSGLDICWSALDAGKSVFYGSAGHLTFADPLAMHDVGISLTTRQNGAIAPVIITFIVSREMNVYNKLLGELFLTLRFRSSELLLAKVAGTPLSPTEAVSADRLTQAECGRLILEAWANDPTGFPTPKGCYFSSIGAGGMTDATSNPIERDLVIVFDRFNGFRNFCDVPTEHHYCRYELVLNMQIGSIIAAVPAVDLYSGCRYASGGCLREYEYFELGRGMLALGAGSRAAAKPWEGRLDESAGFELLGTDGQGVRNLRAKQPLLESILRAAPGSFGVNRSSILRLYLAPLTSWNLGVGARCSATCQGTGSSVCGAVFCTAEQAVTGEGKFANYNIIKMLLPPKMDSIVGDVEHTLHVTTVKLPSAMFFPQRFGIQLSEKNDLSLQYLRTKGYMAYMDPNGPQTDARLLLTGQTGGGPHPFPGDLNLIYVRLQFGITLQAMDHLNARVKTQLEILPPEGFSCRVEGSGAPKHDFDSAEFRSSYVLARQVDARYNNNVTTAFLLDRNRDDFPDVPRAGLSAVKGDGSWDDDTCEYTLAPGQTLFAKQAVFVTLQLRNPTLPMQQIFPANEWKLILRSPGLLQDGDSYTITVESFAAGASSNGLDADLWTRNTAVLGRSPLALVQPGDFTPSASHFVTVLFTTVQEVLANGEFVVDAPPDFSFDYLCRVGALDETLYDSTDFDGAARPLPGVPSCTAEVGPRAARSEMNRARVRLAGRLVARRMYIFQLRVKNAVKSNTDFHCNWYVWTADPSGSKVDGTMAPRIASWSTAVDLDPDPSCWQIYSQSWLNPPTVMVKDNALYPYSAFGRYSTLEVRELSVPPGLPTKVHTSLRVIAPPSCPFVDLLATAVAGLRIDTNKFVLLDAPLLMENGGQLHWQTLEMTVGEDYGFDAPMKCKDQLVRSGAHAFFLEIGYRGRTLSERFGGIVVPAPMLRAIIAAPIDYLSSRAGFQKNVIVFKFWLSSAVAASSDAVILIQGNEGLRGSFLSCWASEVRGLSMEFPEGARCEAGVNDLGAPFLRLLPTSEPFPAGGYKIKVQSSNAVRESEASLPGIWSIGTYERASETLGTYYHDAPASVPSFPIRTRMYFASLSWGLAGSRYEHRPAYWSTVAFSFQLSLRSKPRFGSKSFRIRMPQAFEALKDCSRSINISLHTGDVFDDDKFTCMTEGNIVTVSILEGIIHHYQYAVELQVKNPKEAPTLNIWTMECGNLTSEPLPGRPLAIVTFLNPPSPVSRAAGSTIPVMIQFSLSHAVSAGGTIQVQAPPGFRLHNATALRPKHSAIDVAALLLDLPTSHVANETILSTETGSVGIPAGVPYLLQIFATNAVEGGTAAGQWRLASFSSSEDAQDEGQAEGYALTPAATLVVDNVELNRYSMQDVVIDVSITSPSDILFDDGIRIKAPDGFSLVEVAGSASSLACSGFEWLTWSSPAPRPPAVCSCDYGPCQLDMAFRTDWKTSMLLGNCAYKASTLMKFRLSSVNPARDPLIEGQFWRLLQLRGKSGHVVASSAERSWHIQPLLQDVHVTLAGSSRAAGSQCTLIITFVPVSYADTIWLVAEFPREMLFNDARVEAPLQRDDRTKGHNLIVYNLKLDAGVQATVSAVGVRLGRRGGRSMFSLTTYKARSLAEKVDERIHFPGFFQAGLGTLHGKLRSSYATNPVDYPVRSTLPPRAGEEVEATFTIVNTAAVNFGDELVLSCEGAGAYEIIADRRLKMFRKSFDGNSQDLLRVDVKTLGPHLLRLRLLDDDESRGDAVLESGQDARLTLWVIPTLGINSWRIETVSAEQKHLTNTNDGNSPGFIPVAQLSLLIQAKHTPPDSTIEVNLRASSLRADGLMVPELVLIAPPGFSFPGVCGEFCSSRGGNFRSTEHPFATIAALGATTLLDNEIAFLVSTPKKTPSTLNWIVVANGFTEEVVGWGWARGFQIEQMKDASISYGGVPSTRVQIAITFFLSVNPVEKPFTIIDVTAPRNYALFCKDTALRKISLPGEVGCNADGQHVIRLTLNESLRMRKYAFAVETLLPERSNSSLAQFSLAVRAKGTEAIVDAAFELPGWPLGTILTSQPSIAWSTAMYGEISSVTITITFWHGTSSILSFLVLLPPGFKQRVRSPRDLKSTNTKLPLFKGPDWVDAVHVDRLRILLEPSDPHIAAGSYRFSFPVEVPDSDAAIVAANLWYFLLCADRYANAPNQSGALLSFPMAGFVPGEVSFLEQHRKKMALTGQLHSSTSRVVSFDFLAAWAYISVFPFVL